jgi:hypothetical protein
MELSPYIPLIEPNGSVNIRFLALARPIETNQVRGDEFAILTGVDFWLNSRKCGCFQAFPENRGARAGAHGSNQ